MRIDDILMYWEFTRGRGHTSIALGEMPPDGKFVFVAIHNAQAIQIQRKFPKCRTLTVNSDPESFYGLEMPMIVDHAAMALLIRKEQERLRNIGRNKP